MALRRFRGGEKLTPEGKAAKIKAQYLKKHQNQGLFTQAQEELMAELGLMATGEMAIEDGQAREKENREEAQRVAASGKKPKKRDPLTPRQRKLMRELGLTSATSEPELDPDYEA